MKNRETYWLRFSDKNMSDHTMDSIPAGSLISCRPIEVKDLTDLRGFMNQPLHFTGIVNEAAFCVVACVSEIDYGLRLIKLSSFNKDYQDFYIELDSLLVVSLIEKVKVNKVVRALPVGDCHHWNLKKLRRTLRQAKHEVI